MADIHEADEFNFAIPDISKFQSRDYTGYFYPKFLSEPWHYIHKSSTKLLEKLSALKANGKKIFLASNAYFPVAEIMM